MLFYLWKLIYSMIIRTRREPLRADDKRASFMHSLDCAGSMTVEAALVLPLYLFFMFNILYLFEAARLQSRMLCALHETGMKMAGYAYFISNADDAVQEDTLEEDEVLSGIGQEAVLHMLSAGYIRSSCEEFLGRDYLDHTCLEGGAAAVSYAGSRIMTDNDDILLTAGYRVRPFIPVLGPQGISMESRFCTHAFVGYAIQGTQEGSDGAETMVFITPTGVVYHRSRSCTYLKPSVQTIPAAALDDVRNSGGARYYPCEVCRPQRGGMVIITTDGNRYHSSVSCSAIKRTVLEVPLSSVEGSRRACSKCGGG